MVGHNGLVRSDADFLDDRRATGKNAPTEEPQRFRNFSVLVFLPDQAFHAAVGQPEFAINRGYLTVRTSAKRYRTGIFLSNRNADLLLIDPDKAKATPVLPGSDGLETAGRQF
jgi:hypothetical protein